jgi:hypothetical protein
MDVRTLVCNAYRRAKERGKKSSEERSKEMVRCLAEELREELGTNSSIKLLFRQGDVSKQEFGVKELLYDLVAFEAGTTYSSGSPRKELQYVKTPLWQIESEFNPRDRKVVNDFNKLVLGCAPNKLFVASRRKNRNKFLDMLEPIAKACGCDVCLAIVAHPDVWTEDQTEPEVYLFSAKRWVKQ